MCVAALGGLRRLEGVTVIDRLIPPHLAPGLSCRWGVEALVLTIVAGQHVLYEGAGDGWKARYGNAACSRG